MNMLPSTFYMPTDLIRPLSFFLLIFSFVMAARIPFTTEQFRSFVGDYYPHIADCENPIHEHVRSSLGLYPEDPVTSDHYTRFVSDVIEPNGPMHESWQQHLNSYNNNNPQFIPQEEEQKYQVDVLGVEEMPPVVIDNSVTGAQARMRRFRKERDIEPSFAAAGRVNRNSPTGAAYMHLPTYIDSSTNALRTDRDSKLLLVALKIHPAVSKYVGWKPENVPASPFIISEDTYKKLLQAPRMVMPPRSPQFCQTPLAINNRVTFRVMSEDPRELARHQRSRPQAQYPPAWVQSTLSAPALPLSLPTNTFTGSGRMHHGTPVHPHSAKSGRFIERSSATGASLSSSAQDLEDEAVGAMVRAKLGLNEKLENREVGAIVRWGKKKATQALESKTTNKEASEWESSTGRALRYSSGNTRR